MNFSMRYLLVMLIAAMLTACAAPRPAPVSDARTPAVAVAPKAVQPDVKSTAGQATKPLDAGKIHTIQKGDTLISIALANGLDYRELAAWNNLENPNAIKLGETLRLTVPGSVNDISATSSASPSPSQPQPGAPVTAPLIFTNVPTPAAPPLTNSDKLKTEPKATKLAYSDAAYAKALAESAGSSPPAPVAATIGNPAASLPAASVSAASVPATATQTVPTVNVSASDDVEWAWPIQPVPKGKIVAMYTEVNKGIDIAGIKGTPILASAPGKVVYSGAGLRGYGRLVIIKHNATWLSAYAHNEKILVTEGEEIKKGQKIAEMGSSDADQVKLHFEIRKQGKPLDPLQFLPK